MFKLQQCSVVACIPSTVLPGTAATTRGVTGVMVQGGVVKCPPAHVARLFSPPQAPKNLGDLTVFNDF